MKTKFLQSGEGDPLMIGGNHYFFKHRGDEDPNGASVFEATVTPGSSPPLHVHHHADEMIIVVEGEILCNIGDEWQTVKQGGICLMPKGIRHTWINATDQTAKAYAVFLSGGIDNYFFDMAEMMKGLPPGPPPPDMIASLGEKYDFAVLGPPLTWKPLINQLINLKNHKQ